MQKIIRKEREFWVGIHPKLGPVIFDPASQAGVASDQVRLYKLKDKSASVFVKSIVWEKIASCSEVALAELEDNLNAYDSAMPHRRAHCYKCKRHLDSVDLSSCGCCGWIRCFCGACGCQYGTRHKPNSAIA